jgi:hypothetical protein
MDKRIFIALGILLFILTACDQSDPIKTQVDFQLTFNTSIDNHTWKAIGYHDGSYIKVKTQELPNISTLKATFLSDGNITSIEFIFGINGSPSRQEAYWFNQNGTQGWYVLNGPRVLYADIAYANWKNFSEVNYSVN